MPKFDIIASVTIQLKYTVDVGTEGEADGGDYDYRLDDPTDAAELADAVKADLEDDTELDRVMSQEGYTISNVSLSAHASK